jgi:hypothetical protein
VHGIAGRVESVAATRKKRYPADMAIHPHKVKDSFDLRAAGSDVQAVFRRPGGGKKLRREAIIGTPQQRIAPGNAEMALFTEPALDWSKNPKSVSGFRWCPRTRRPANWKRSVHSVREHSNSRGNTAIAVTPMAPIGACQYGPRRFRKRRKVKAPKG